MGEVRTSQSSRRAFFGLGGAAAAGLIASDLLTTPAAPVVAAVPAPRPRETDPEPLPVRGEPFAAGGPETRDQSIASAVTTAPAVAPGKQYTTYTAAAKAAGASTSVVFPGYNPPGHLLRRATFGANPSDRVEIRKYGLDGWINRQLSPSTFADPAGDAAWKAYPLAGASAAVIRKSIAEFSWDAVFQTAQASLARQVFSNRQLYEITVDIFANHLHVPLPGEQWHTAPSYLTQVIRANAFGSFTTMLLAAMKHPAMLTFLNNDESRKANVNENLGRELLELHTVGIASGYTESDVRNSANILSGRSWNWKTGVYVYNAAEHVTGPVKVLGFTHANATGAGGQAVGDAYLTYLAKHPSTARNIARKIAVRFVSDNPSEDLINRLAAVYLAKNTNIRETVKAVFLSSDFWASVGTRMRRPLEDAVGTLRVLGVGRAPKWKTPMGWLYWNLNEAGHTPHGWMPPNGYPDVAAAWLGAGAMIQRWNLHRTFVYGWWKEFVYVAPEKIVPRTAKMTTLQWTTAVSHKVLLVAPSAAHLEAVLTAVGRAPDSPAPTSGWECGKITTLLLDSPYFQLR